MDCSGVHIEMLPNASLEEMKFALNTWNNNMKNLEIISLLDSVSTG